MDERLGSPANTASLRPPKSMSDSTYERLLDMILTRQLLPGVVLQERSLCGALDVSRTPLREALKRLEGEGMVLRQANRALVVKETTINDFVEALQVRRLLEAETVALAAERMPDGMIGELRGRIRSLMESPAPTTSEHWGLDDVFHEQIAISAGNDLIVSVVRDMRRRTGAFNLKRMPNRFLPGCQEHLAILDAIEARDPQAARTAMVTHLENAKMAIFDKLVRG